MDADLGGSDVAVVEDADVRVSRVASAGRWRFAALAVWVTAGIAIVVTMTVGMVTLIGISEKTNHSLKALQRASDERTESMNKLTHLVESADRVWSPEARAENDRKWQDTLRVTLEIADCDNREALQAVVDELETDADRQDGELRLVCEGEPVTTTPP